MKISEMVSEERINTAKKIFGDDSEQWIAESTQLAEKIASSKDIEITGCSEKGCLSLVFFGRMGTDNVVLKIPSTPEEGRMEFNTMRAWSSTGINKSPNVLWHDNSTGAFIMEFIRESASNIHDSVSPSIIKEISDLLSMIKKGRSFYPGIKRKDSYVKRVQWSKGNYENIKTILPETYEFYNENKNRIDSLVDNCLNHPLHGDFQMKNIIINKGSFFAIDPKPSLGDIESDVASILVDLNLDDQGASNIARTMNYDHGLGINLEKLQEWLDVYCLIDMTVDRPYSIENLLHRSFLRKTVSDELKSFVNGLD